MNTYVQAVSAEERNVQSKVVEMLLPAEAICPRHTVQFIARRSSHLNDQLALFSTTLHFLPWSLLRILTRKVP